MEHLVLVLGMTVLTVALFKYFNLPSIIAYLLIGVLLGPHSLGVLDNTDQISLLAEIGVVFLLFTIGLELPLAKFMDMRYNLLLIGSSQVFLCTVLMTIMMCLFGNGFIVSLVASSALSLSSTAIIMRQLSEQNELFAKHGQLSFAMLIFQDIAVVPLLILLPLIAKFQTTATISNFEMVIPVISILFKGAIVFSIIIALSRTLLKTAFHKIAGTRSLELFMFAVLFVALLAAFVTHEFGLSMSFGAFVAGIGLGESEFRHQIDAEVRPFRDILLGIFFISIGMLLDLSIVANNFLSVYVAVAAIVLIKFLVVSLLCFYLGRRVNLHTALKTGLIMAHAGEFGLAILTLSVSYNILSGDFAQIILAAMILSLFIAVILVKYADNILYSLFKLLGLDQDKNIDQTNYDPNEFERHASPMVSHYPDLTNHVIICGFGRVGKTLAKVLQIRNIPYIALETNSRIVKNSVVAGFNVYFGDSANSRDILALASLNNAKMVAVCVDHDEISKKIITNIKSLNNSIPVLVRTRDLMNSKCLLESGASEVISETEEVSMMLALNMLMFLGVESEDAMSSINSVRQKQFDFFSKYMLSDGA